MISARRFPFLRTRNRRRLDDDPTYRLGGRDWPYQYLECPDFGHTRSRIANADAAIDSLGYTARQIRESFKPNVALIVTDEADADLPAFFSGELRVAKDRPVEAGDVFVVNGDGDTADDALQGAKGSAPAEGDRFEVTNVSADSEAVKYLGSSDVDVSSYSLDRGAG